MIGRTAKEQPANQRAPRVSVGLSRVFAAEGIDRAEGYSCVVHEAVASCHVHRC
jgi:hypothetical protein